ncbi:hypothetical protein O181_125249 [Austropuccinia psidii MF-1]|uniref:Uncharacterized protein n=1 Tax=Austropuccinia psidii MF-1 TaxID=1389203 RepID=A0A9Q3KTR1_9BASI|nr:hypothetical protein [Austropuccinia psidii MF-1]
MDKQLRKSLFWRSWECQEWFNLQDFEIKNGKISKISGGYIANNATLDFHWEEALMPSILTSRNDRDRMNTEDFKSFYEEYLFKALKREKWRGGKFVNKGLVKKILGQRR